MNLAQLKSCRSAEFWVKPQNLDGERHLVGDALAGAVAAGEKFEVGQVIESPVSVFVMHRLIRKKFAAKMLGHDVAMFKDVSLFAHHASRDLNSDVTVPSDGSVEVSRIVLGDGASPKGRVLASVVAKSLLSSNGAVRSSPMGGLFAALNASKDVPRVGIAPAPSVRAWHGAVKRVLTEAFSIGVEVARCVGKSCAAILAREVRALPSNNLRSAVDFFECRSARSAAKPLCQKTWLKLEFGRAPLAGLLNGRPQPPMIGLRHLGSMRVAISK